MSETNGRVVPLTKEILFKIIEGYEDPRNFIFESHIIRTYGYPVKTIPGADDLIRKKLDNLSIPFEDDGITKVGDRNYLVFKNDGENEKIYLLQGYYPTELSQSESDYQLFYYEFPKSVKDIDSRSDRREMRKKESLYNAYLLKRDEWRETQDKFNAYVMVRDLIAEARRSMESGEPLRYTINGWRKDPEEFVEMQPLSEGERKRKIDSTLEQLMNEKREKFVNNPLKEPRGGKRKEKTKKMSTKKRKLKKQRKSRRKKKKY